MDRTLSTLIIATVILLLLALMVVGWRNRSRRQGDVAAPRAVPPELGDALLTVTVLYVATTRDGAPLDRITVHGLGFRARGELALHSDGIAVAIDGRRPWFIPRAEVRGAGRATWTIDRVVEEGGLLMVAWTSGEAQVDSYFRVTDADVDGATTALLTSLQSLVSAPVTSAAPDAPTTTTEKDPS
jgi:hypothetical protein